MEDVKNFDWLIYDDCSGSTDFLRNILLNIPPENQLRLSKVCFSNVATQEEEVLNVIGKSNVGILCFNYQLNKDADDIFSVVEMLKPTVVIMLGDDQGEQPIFNNLSLLVPLFVRQYSHKNHTKFFPPQHRSPLILPLFPRLFDDDNQSDVKRHIVWASQYPTPEIMFENRDASFVLWNSEIDNNEYAVLKPKDHPKRYKEVIFAPCRTENSNIDVTQIYEACCYGAIPVIVGNEEDIVSHFSYLNNPPFLFAEYWHQAVEKMKALTKEENANLLTEGQEQLKIWWVDCISSYQNFFSKVLTDYKNKKN